MTWFNAARKVKRSSGSQSSGTTFNLPLQNSGPSNLPSTITQDGYSLDLVWLYRGDDADLTSWDDSSGNSGSLTYSEGATGALINQPAPFTDGCQSVNPRGSNWEGEVDASEHQIDSDFLMVFAIKYNGSGDSFINNNLFGNNSTTSQGWLLRDVSSTTLWFTVSDGADRNRVNIVGPSGYTDGAWQIFTVCGDLDETNESYSLRGAFNLDSVAGGNDTALGSMGSLVDTSGRLRVPDEDQSIAFAAMYKATDVFPGGSHNASVMDPLIKQVASRVMGLYANGDGTPTPSTHSRTSAAYLPVVNSSGEEQWNYVGSDWPRVGSMLQADGFSVAKGYLSEESRTQQLPGTESLASDWLSLNATAVDGYEDTISAPVVGSTVTLLHIENGDSQHKIQGNLDTNDDATLSVFAKLHPDSPFNHLYIYTGFSKGDTVFDLSNGTITLNTHDAAGIRSVGDGWYHCWCYHTGLSNFPILISDNVTFNHTGGTQPCFYLCAPQGEHTSGSPPSSYIPNTASSGTVTRAVDQLVYVGDDGAIQDPNNGFSIDATINLQDHDTVSTMGNIIFSLREDSSNEIYPSITHTDQDFIGRWESTAEDNNITLTTTDVSDGYQHTIRMSTPDGYSLSVQNVNGGYEGTATRTAPLPTSFSSINIGSLGSSSLHLDGIVGRVKIRRKPK